MVPPVRPRTGPARPRPPSPELVLAGRGWVAGRLQPLEVGIDADGRICAVGRSLNGARRHDVGDRLLLPAATDIHVHLREPGPPDPAETIARGTESAALAGVGLVGEMPNTLPPTDSVDHLEQKAGRVNGHAAVDVLLYALPRLPAEIPGLARRAGGFKLYLSPTTAIDEVPADRELPGLLDVLARYDLPVAVHAEEPSGFRGADGAPDPAAWDAARPVEAERAAIARVISAPPQLRIHVAHVTTAGSARAVRDRGLSCEVTAHHLLLAAGTGRDARWKVNPPLRAAAERDALWEAFRRGEVPVLASDHAPHSVASKSAPFATAPSGMPGLETTVPLLLAKVGRAELDLSVLLRAACDRPARLLGQPIGRLSVGHRAHILVVDFRSRTTIRADRLRSACGWSAFEGMEAVFPVEHWRDGERIVEGAEYVGRPTGRVVRPEFAPGAAPFVPT